MEAAYKLVGTEVAITTNTQVSNATLIRVLNTGATGVINVYSANSANLAQISTLYGNVTIANTHDVVIAKISTDFVQGPSGLLVVPIAWR